MRVSFNARYHLKTRNRSLTNVEQFGVSGKFIDLAKGRIQELYHINDIFMTNSCTSALEMMAWCGISHGEIIMPSWTFASTASVFARAGYKVRFVDVEPKTLCITAEAVERAINNKTTAVLVVDYAGVICPDMVEISNLCHKYGLALFEDAAPAFGNPHVSGIADLTAFSFNDTKNIGCGEGGALLVNDTRYMENLEIQAFKGTNYCEYRREGLAFYTWAGKGAMPLMTNITAACLYPDLSRWDAITIDRRSSWQLYRRLLQDQLPDEFTMCSQEGNGHCFWIMAPSIEVRVQFQRYMDMMGIETARHYQPLDESPAGEAFTTFHGLLPNTWTAAVCIIRLPMHNHLNRNEIEYVAEHAIKAAKLAIMATAA